MTGKRKRYSADFKAKVALEALRGDRTVAELGAKHGVHPTMITAWKKQAVEGMAGVFSGKGRGRGCGRGPRGRGGEAPRQDRAAGGGAGFFVEKPPVDEPGPEASDDRSAAPTALDPAAVPAGVDQPLGFLLSAGGRDVVEPGADASCSTLSSWKRHGTGHARWPAACAARGTRWGASASGGSWPKWAWRRSIRRRARRSGIRSTGFTSICCAIW